MIKTPEEIVKEYENGLQGFTYDEEATNSFLSKLPIPLFSQVNTLYGDGKGKLSLPWKALEKFYPALGTDEAQRQGDCVSMGTRNAVDLTRSYEILYNKDKEVFLARGATEPIYGCRGHGGEGMQGHQAAEFVSTKAGFLLRENHTDIGVDLSKYSPEIGAKWGRSGVPKNVIEKASKHRIKTCSLVTSIEEARDLLANGYGLAICSNWGFGSKRDKFGIAEAGGSWNHCYTDQTLIYGPNGQRPIKDYKIGDRVFDHSGNIEKVENTFVRDYSGEMINITSWGLPSFKVTPEHPILVFREVENVKYIEKEEELDSNILVIKREKVKTITRKKLWIEAKNIKVGDWLLTPKVKYNVESFKGLEYGSISPKTLNIPKQLTEPDDDIAWMFGFYIGDGNTVKNHKVSFTFSSKELHIVDRLRVAFEKLGLKITFKFFGTFIRAHCYSSILARCFDTWFGKYSVDRQIPEFLISQGWDMKSLIRGIYDADGFTFKNHDMISMCNKGLILQIRNLLINIDQSPSVFRQKRNGGYPNGRDLYTITISEKPKYHTKKYNGYFCNPVRKIEKTSENCQVYNLEVSNSHTYIADGVISHNCMALIGMDDTRTRSNEMLGLILNSWDPSWISGPLVDQPPNSFWARQKPLEAMIAQRQTFVFSDFDGYTRKQSWDKVRTIYS